MAAVAASRYGAKTLLIERYGFLGGMATLSMVSPISVFKKNGKRIIDGIPYEFVERLAEMGGALTTYPNGNIPFDPEIYKLAAQRMVLESKAELLLHTAVCDCIISDRDGTTVTYLVTESKSGRQAIEAAYVVDCTGDADIIRQAGFMTVSAENKEALQPMTLWFRLGGVDTDRLENMHMCNENTRYFNSRIKNELYRMSANKDIPNFGGPWFITTLRPGEAAANITRFAGDGVNAMSLTEAECTLREDTFKIIDILRNNFDEFKNCYLIDTGIQVGVRETRRIKGLYQMTADDILVPKSFYDTIAKGAHPIDIHQTRSNGQEVRFVNEEYNIPYRSLVPVGSSNILAAGRCISATREAFASIRVQATCMAIGQAAGLAAAICSDKKIEVAAISMEYLRSSLSRQKAII